MLREYAIDPKVVTSDINILQRFYAEFGADKGRVIAEVPLRWFQSFKTELDKLGLRPIEKARYLENLNKKIKTTLISRGDRRLAEDESWITHVVTIHDREQFNAILSDNDDINRKIYNYPRMIEFTPINWEIAHSVSVEPTADDIVNTIQTSINLSTQFMFIDPYFNIIDDRFRSPFFKFITKIKNNRARTNCLQLHLCEQNDIRRSQIERSMNDHLVPFLKDGFKVEVHIWPKKYIHDRFILTNKVGYSYGHGFSTGDDLNINITRLSEDLREYEKKGFVIIHNDWVNQ
ncbi:hypothetical protein HA45_03430 [Pantoea rodasii]|uniref:hypothetical protein n=1 Tax=Pantoea rodasii TaxID=1076549 RepID=UPI000A244E56|nr:hypothetical protein [Pantoea rodasii]ORM65834.1 hypothetical protein HA45_03430 [Pantoea rodasii]